MRIFFAALLWFRLGRRGRAAFRLAEIRYREAHALRKSATYLLAVMGDFVRADRAEKLADECEAQGDKFIEEFMP